MTAGLYIHLPFCKQKCFYCDFASFAGKEFLIDDYLSALNQEAARPTVRRFDTLYVGGGTPSLLSAAQIKNLAALVERHFGPVAAFAESTFEANPESLTSDKLRVLRAAGFNRLSLGLQSLNDTELKTMGRIHSAQAFLTAFNSARQAGFDNISLDLIAGVPGQTLESFLNTLERAILLKPEHISVYGLQIEEGTPFFERGVLCNQELMRRMLEHTRTMLGQNRYEQYEISNFSLPGRAAVHNTRYWQNAPYVGLGSGAASYVGGVRSQNISKVEEYIQKIRSGQSAVGFFEHLTGQAAAGERLMLALRMMCGAELSRQDQSWFGAEVARHVQAGLLRQKGNHISLTEEGLFLANEVFCSFVPPFEEEDLCL